MYVNTFRRVGVEVGVNPGFRAVVTSQRACRSFTDEPVADAVIEELLEAATHAPSAENTQPWVFVVVRDPELRGRASARSPPTRGRTRAATSPATASRPGLFAEVERGATGGVSDAPVLVVVGGDTTRCVEAALAASIFPAIQNLLLAAHSAGLGSALTTLPTFAGRPHDDPRPPRPRAADRGRPDRPPGEAPRPAAARARRREDPPRPLRQPLVAPQDPFRSSPAATGGPEPDQNDVSGVARAARV